MKTIELIASIETIIAVPLSKNDADLRKRQEADHE